MECGVRGRQGRLVQLRGRAGVQRVRAAAGPQQRRTVAAAREQGVAGGVKAHAADRPRVRRHLAHEDVEVPHAYGAVRAARAHHVR